MSKIDTMSKRKIGFDEYKDLHSRVDKRKLKKLNGLEIEVLNFAYSNPSGKWFEINYSVAVAKHLKINQKTAWRVLNKLANLDLLERVETYPVLFNPVSSI